MDMYPDVIGGGASEGGIHALNKACQTYDVVLRADWLSENDQGRERQRTHCVRSGTLGLRQPCHAGFSTARKTHGHRFIEAFNTKLRAECLSAHWFMNLADAREKLEDWHRHYN